MDWLGWATLSWMINAFSQGLAVAATVWVLLRLLPRANAATRYAVWWAALVLVIVLPLWAPPAGVSAAASGSQASQVTLPAPGSWPLWLLGGWILAAVWKLVRIGRSYASMQRLKERPSSVRADHQERFTALLGAFPGRRSRSVVLRASREIAVPVAAGLWRPAVLVPEALLEGLSPEELEQVLVHELAHLRRGDDWSNLGQKVVEALLVFHPAVWWIGRRLNLERELASDDWVVSLTGRPRPYAACLTKLAERRLRAARPQLAPGAVSRKRQITERIEALLDGRRNASPRFARRLLAGAGCVVLIAAAAAVRFAPVAVALPTLAALPMARTAPSVPAAALLPVRQAAIRPGPRHTMVRAAWRAGRQKPTYVYVIYFAGDDSGWLRIVWVARTAPPALKRT